MIGKFSNTSGYEFVAVIFLLFSCHSSYDYTYFDREDIKHVEEFDVKLPFNFVNQTKWSVYTESGRLHLLEYGRTKEGDLLIFPLDLEAKAYGIPIQIPREGPEGFNATDAAVQILTRDSILVFPIPSKRFYLYNDLGHLLRTYEYESEFEFYLAGFFSSAIKMENHLIFPTSSSLVRYDDPSYFQKVLPVHVFDIHNSKFVQALPYPKQLEKKYLWSFLDGASLSTFQDSLVLINFRFSDSLYTYSTQTQNVQSKFLGINAEPLGLVKPPTKGEELNLILKEKDYLYTLAEDHILYRVVTHLDKWEMKNVAIQDIVDFNYRRMTVIRHNSLTNETRYIDMPLTRYFIPYKGKLIVGSVDTWEDEDNDQWRKFFIYEF
ncbi:hypothetical protein [Mongoliitalea daihaiensis]|uniref:hypothetical protein n=1 Tax=Mongoliitalea daihaiensis TaxID=2782006 RepID=UPI001F394F7D|nr:hypothetical protein [Mongoliitalea daihaiensis]UJP63361.1 hypothetical protein IPZ59_10915 [Mongoliitalea daihaiensis]